MLNSNYEKRLNDEIRRENGIHYTNYENILKVNVDKFPEIARQFGIMSIPTLMIFEEGKVVAKNVGFMSKEDLTEFLK